jgi:mRNA degradation ribonuclease J1/J2
VFHRLRGIEPADIVFTHSHFQHAGKIQFYLFTYSY